jgi:hypothetical protein
MNMNQRKHERSDLNCLIIEERKHESIAKVKMPHKQRDV